MGVRHHCVRPIYSCKMRLRWCLVEYELSSIQCVAGPAGAHPGLQDRIFLHKNKNWECAWSRPRKKTQFFIMYSSPANFYSSFPFSPLRHYQIPECFYVKKKLLMSSCNSSIMLQKSVMWSLRLRLHWSDLTDKIKTIVSNKGNYRGTKS